jgi:hypothetical protein
MSMARKVNVFSIDRISSEVYCADQYQNCSCSIYIYIYIIVIDVQSELKSLTFIVHGASYSPCTQESVIPVLSS